MKYFVLTISRDGDIYLYKKTREEILEELNSGKIRPRDTLESPFGDLREVTAGTYIFKGELVVPFAKKVVEEYDII